MYLDSHFIIQWLIICVTLPITILDLVLTKRAIGKRENYSSMLGLIIYLCILGLINHSQTLPTVLIAIILLTWFAIMHFLTSRDDR